MTEQTVAGSLIDPMELEEIITEVLDALMMNAGMDLEAPVPPEPGVEATPLSGEILIHADTEARLVIDTDAQVCAVLARFWEMVGPEGVSPEDTGDALGELCNLVGATVKTVFEEESHVGIPSVTHGPGPEWDAEAIQIWHAVGKFTARFGPN